MRLEAIDWPLRQRVEDLRRACGNETSAHAFSSLYLWKAEMGLSLLVREDLFAVRFGMRGANSWFFPCGAPAAVRAFAEERMGREGSPAGSTTPGQRRPPSWRRGFRGDLTSGAVRRTMNTSMTGGSSWS